MAISLAAITAISALASTALSAFANRRAQENMKQYNAQLKAGRAETEQKIQRLENEDALQTKQGSALANEAREALQEQNEAAAGRDAVMGGSGLNAAKTKAANSEILRRTYSDIVRNHEATTGARIANLEGMKSNYDNLIAQGSMQQANANIQSASSAAKGIIGAVSAGAAMYGAQNGGTQQTDNGTQQFIKDGNAFLEQNGKLNFKPQFGQHPAQTASNNGNLDIRNQVNQDFFGFVRK